MSSKDVTEIVDYDSEEADAIISEIESINDHITGQIKVIDQAITDIRKMIIYGRQGSLDNLHDINDKININNRLKEISGRIKAYISRYKATDDDNERAVIVVAVIELTAELDVFHYVK